MFKQHLEMIGRNETASKKAKFWQSYIRSLKGSDDIRAQDAPKARTWRSDYSPVFKSIYDEPSTASERITGAGYRYLPVHRDTYGYSPRAIYSHHYNKPTSTYETRYDAEKAWQEHQDRMREIERRYPSRYGLYLKDKPSTSVVPLEYEPEDKPTRAGSRGPRSSSVPPLRSVSQLRAASPLRGVSPLRRLSPLRGCSLAPLPLLSHGLRAASLSPQGGLDAYFSEYDQPSNNNLPAKLSPTPVKTRICNPRDSEVAFDREGSPVFRSGWVPYNSLLNMRDPYLDFVITDHRPLGRIPAHLRDTLLSPARQALLW